MEYRRLGQCGLKVSEICLGTMTFGRGADLAEARRLIDQCGYGRRRDELADAEALLQEA